MATRDWRRKTDYAEIEDFTPRELAWEYLRRNPDFKRDQRRIKKAESTSGDDIAQTWGLRFPGRYEPGCEGSGGVLVAFPGVGHRHADGCAPESYATAA